MYVKCIFMRPSSWQTQLCFSITDFSELISVICLTATQCGYTCCNDGDEHVMITNGKKPSGQNVTG